jgi:hypothetical protein
VIVGVRAQQRVGGLGDGACRVYALWWRWRAALVAPLSWPLQSHSPTPLAGQVH